MKKALPFLFVVLAYFVLTRPAHAIIFLPALLLIPIAKVVAIIIGGFTLPSLGAGLLWHKLFGSKLAKVITVTILLLITGTIILFLVLHYQNPDRPLF